MSKMQTETAPVLKIKDIIAKSTQFFKDRKIDTPRLDAELLIADALKLQRIDLYLKFDQPLSEPELAKCRELVKRRSQGEPVAYLVGHKEFFALPFKVNSHVLVPRPETETLVEKILEWATLAASTHGLTAPRILDLGTGSGCVGISLAKNLPDAQVTMVDVSAEALAVARGNAELNGVADRCRFIEADASTLAPEVYDIVVANPPYIAKDDPAIQASVKQFEPGLALFAEDQGLALIKAWSKQHAPSLSAPGIMAFEFGSTQGAAVKEIFEQLQVFSQVQLVRDLAGLDRHMIGTR